jgi:hypothetical protein
MDAPELRQRIGQLTETLALSLGELVALAAEYDAELIPPPASGDSGQRCHRSTAGYQCRS